jgi:glycosyltransferase involved in cell wall biosynthesis
MKKVIVSVTNDLTSDQRVDRICKTLENWGYQVTLIGRLLPDSDVLYRTYPCHRIKLFFNRKFIFYLEYNFRLFFLLLFTKADVLLANDLDTLPANYLISKIKRKKLILDIHEYFTETPEVFSRKKVRFVWQCIEKWFIRGIDAGYTVSGSIAEIYHQKYNLSLQLIRNVPVKLLPKSIEKNEVEVPYILYQGNLNVGRGIELIIRSLAYLSEVKFYIAGAGTELSQLKKTVAELSLQDRVLFLGKISPDQLKKITLHASVGISMEEPLGLSYKFALPNKLFDYIQARVPVLVSDLPEMKSIVIKYKLGLVAFDRSPANIASLLNIMIFDRELSRIWKSNLEIAAEELCWEMESLKLRSIFP